MIVIILLKQKTKGSNNFCYEKKSAAEKKGPLDGSQQEINKSPPHPYPPVHIIISDEKKHTNQEVSLLNTSIIISFNY